MANASQESHGHFMLLVRVSGMDERTIDARAREIHEAYMAKYGPRGAFTIAHLKLERVVKQGTNAEHAPEWGYALRYFGPADSVAWLQENLESIAHSAGAELTTQTFMARDITGRY